MTVITNKTTIDEVTESNETYLDKLFNKIAAKWRGKKIDALKAWHVQEIWAELETLKYRHKAAIVELEKKHRQAMQDQKDAWVQVQKMRNTAHCLDRYGTLDEMERMGLITTMIDEDGFVTWTIAKHHRQEAC